LIVNLEKLKFVAVARIWLKYWHPDVTSDFIASFLVAAALQQDDDSTMDLANSKAPPPLLSASSLVHFHDTYKVVPSKQHGAHVVGMGRLSNVMHQLLSEAAATLLHIEKKSPLLNRAQARTFHSVVARLIYASMWEPALSFLYSRVSAPTEQDERKLQRLLEYLYGMIDLKLRLGANSLNEFTTWVDASFTVHNDMCSHTGGVGLICISIKQSVNTKSSTEAELIGASDYLPSTIYVKMFMVAQGHRTTKATFYQDNESAIKMESNGKASCGQRSRHIDIRYFFITDHVKQQSIKIEHCPTGIMLADFFTKPLQGSLFRMYRSVLLGEVVHSALSVSPPTAGNVERVVKKSSSTESPDPATRFIPGVS
jgi:hypothetical protein